MAKKSSSAKAAKAAPPPAPPAAPVRKPIMRHKAVSKVQTTLTHTHTFGPRPHALPARQGWGDFDIEIDSITPVAGPPVNVTVTGSATQSQGVTLSATCCDSSGNDIGALIPPAPTFDPAASTWTHNQFTNGNLTSGSSYLYTVTGTLVVPGTPGASSPGSTATSSNTTTVSASAWFTVP